MGRADDMQKFTEEVKASYDERARAQEELVTGVETMLKGFAVERKTMSAEQQKHLTDFVENLSRSVVVMAKSTDEMLKAFRQSHQEMSTEQARKLADFHQTLSQNVGALMDGFRKNRAEMGAEQAKNLAAFIGDLSQSVQDLMTATHSMMDGFRQNRGAMSKELHIQLTQDIQEMQTYVKNKLQEFHAAHAAMGATMKKDFAEDKAQRVQDVQEIRTTAQNKVQEFHEAHAAMSAAMKKELGQFAADLASKTRNLLAGFQGERAEMAADSKKAAAQWQGLTATLAKRRAGLKPSVEHKAAPAEPPVEQVQGAETEKRPLEPEVQLEAKMLEFIKSHPEGVTVGDMEAPLQTPRSNLGKVAKGLWEQGKLRKEEKTYFPV
jgi:hypothetical protein